ncbi:MAG: signal peptide peptidase SppA, partial [Muribaculaceae bacterium]|nr:signal peptide peptidase SppA [Muribaculaceae bacterium]
MMKRFFSSMLAALAAIWISIPLLGIVGLIFLGAVVSIGSIEKQPVKVSDNSVLFIDLATTLAERPSNPDMHAVIYGIEEEATLLQPTVSAIRRAASDNNIKGIYIDAGALSSGLASVYTLASAINDFREESGKWVIAYGDNISQASYIVASGASELYLNPEGMVDIHGLASNITFYKGLLDKLGVEVQVVKVGTFKSAVEPYILTEISDANRMQMEALLNSMWDRVKDHIAINRDTDPDNIDAWADSMLLTQAPATLVRRNIVDSLIYRHQAEEIIKDRLGIPHNKNLPLIPVESYSDNDNPINKFSRTRNGKEIAVLYAEGEITESGSAGIASDRLVPQILDLAENNDVAAMVLRVNSPGGSAFASEQIWEALEQFKKTGKPLYVSMGDYAASGGYYISCGADRIYASPVTLTGSIGIFGLIPNLQGLLTDRLGITQSTVSTNKSGNFPDITKPLTSFELASMQNMVNRGYETFTNRCAEGRGMDIDSIKAIAEGRVWDGATALNIGLVDELGTLDQAVEAIAAEAGLDSYTMVEYPDCKPNIWSILISASRDLDTSVRRIVMDDEAYTLYSEINRISALSGVQALTPPLHI